MERTIVKAVACELPRQRRQPLACYSLRDLVRPVEQEPGLRPNEHEYERGGALQYLAAWDVIRAVAIGLCEPKTGIEPFHCLVDKVMPQTPYRQARRVFWLIAGGSSHRGDAFAQRLRTWYPNSIAVALPVHASWLNQIEIHFSIIQRKVLKPNDFKDLAEVRQQLIAFEAYYAQIAELFDWRFTSKKTRRMGTTGCRVGKNLVVPSNPIRIYETQY